MFNALHTYPSLAEPPAIVRSAAILDELKVAVLTSYRALTAATAGAKNAKAGIDPARRAFAERCATLWLNRAQGVKSGRNFSRDLKEMGISRSTAYRAMWRYNLVPRDTKPKPSAKVPRLSLKTLVPLVGDPTAFGTELTGLLQAVLGVSFVLEVRLP